MAADSGAGAPPPSRYLMQEQPQPYGSAGAAPGVGVAPVYGAGQSAYAPGRAAQVTLASANEKIYERELH